jgi:hypothetical protein
MSPAPRFASRRLPETLKSRIEVATAMAWEALVDTHVIQSLHFIQLLSDRLPIEDTLPRYLLEMDLAESMASAVRTRVLATGDESQRPETNPPIALRPDQDGTPVAAEEDEGGWRRFRPDVALREMRQRARRDTETENLIKLAFARAEESIIATHVDGAITFAALLDEVLPLNQAVQEYLDAVGLSGGRAQAVHQRTMARLADVHLPLPPPSRT